MSEKGNFIKSAICQILLIYSGSIPGLNLKKRIGKSGEVSYTSLGYGREEGFKGKVVRRG
jgi:hypothetical protein